MNCNLRAPTAIFFIYLLLIIAMVSSGKHCVGCAGNPHNEIFTNHNDTISAENILDTSKVVFDSLDFEIFKQIADSFTVARNSSHSAEDLIPSLGHFFIDREYTSQTIERKTENKVVVNLREFDCVTFVESVFALYKTIAGRDTGFYQFTKELENIRYRNGTLAEFPSRLHYFTDWIYNKQETGLIKDVTKDLGGTAYTKTIDYMTSHRANYHRLADSTFYKEMLEIESDISKREYYYIPKDKISLAEELIKTGDILCITTGIKGLDAVHVGFAYRQPDGLYMMHASSQHQKVVITEKPLKDYLAGKKSQSGIIVCRIVESEK